MLTALLIGLAAGFLAGMLGIGGGFIFVPLMTHFHPELGLHGAMATSAGFAVCAGLSSYLSHRRHSALLGKLLAPIIAGGFCGALIGPRIRLLLSDRVLALAFAGCFPYIPRHSTRGSRGCALAFPPVGPGNVALADSSRGG